MEDTMALFVIDLMGDDDVIVIRPEVDSAEKARQDEMRRKVLEDIFRRSPQPQLEIVPVER